MSVIDGLKARGAKAQALLNELKDTPLTLKTEFALGVVLKTPLFAIECSYPLGAVDESGQPLDCIEPTDSFKRVVKAAKENNINAIMAEHARLIGVKRKNERKAKGLERIAFEPSNNKQADRQARARTFDDKLKAALGVAVYGAEGVGHSVLFDLMWPAETFLIHDVRYEAYRFLIDTLDLALRTARPHDLAPILQASAARMEAL